ncbi:hypothetical protein T484DRAFT_1941628 [Baffinella frigidus]|nr:hypothetical protein T484DRAFT_1941628 [Cryptophyta sp. CCMP2293]
MYHHHWPSDPVQEGKEALFSQISTETDFVRFVHRWTPVALLETAALRCAPAAQQDSTDPASLESTAPGTTSVTWENFGDAASSSPPSKRPRHSAPRGSSSEPSPRNDHISSSSMRPTTAPTSKSAKSPPAGGLPPKEAVLGVTSSSSADTAAATAVLTIMRDNNGTTSSTSLEASIMTKVAEIYPDLSPSAFRRATKDLISKGVITTSPSRGNSRDRHLHITPDLARASPKGPDPIAGVTQHNTRATILELVAKSHRPLGLDFAELWTLYDAAVPTPDQMTYYLEFQRLLDQKILVLPEDAPPGPQRFIMKADYDYRTDRMATLPSVKGNTSTSTKPSRPTGPSRIPRISDAPPPAVRYTVKPTEEVIDQKILVPSDSSTPGMERVTIQVGYDHLTDLITQLPSDEEDNGAPSASPRPKGTQRIPRISDAPTPANTVRYTVTPTGEQREAIVAPLRPLLVRSVRFASKERVRIIPHRLDFQQAECAPA